LLIMAVRVQAQDSSLLKMLDDSMQVNARPDVTTATFKATQIVNTPTVESPARQVLQFMIMHRFGRLNEGAYALFGLDNASIRFGLDYGITDRLAVGVGRSSVDKTFDGSVKWKALRQTKGVMPVSLSLYGLVTNSTLRYPDKPYLDARYRTSYTAQALIARKMSSRLSLQLSPAWVHFNLVPTPQDQNDVLSLGAGGRMKLTNRMSINAEYSYLPGNPVVSSTIHNSLSLGIDLETGGHVFQLIFTNSNGMIGPYYLTKTDGTWGKGDIYFGFNISRVFNLKRN
jgi:hypothetical protein